MKIPEIPWKTPRKIPDGFTVKYNGTARESRFLLLKSIVKSRKVLVKFRGNFPENSRKTPGKLPENSRKTPDVFYYKCNVTERKSLFLLL